MGRLPPVLTAPDRFEQLGNALSITSISILMVGKTPGEFVLIDFTILAQVFDNRQRHQGIVAEFPGRRSIFIGIVAMMIAVGITQSETFQRQSRQRKSFSVIHVSIFDFHRQGDSFRTAQAQGSQTTFESSVL